MNNLNWKGLTAASNKQSSEGSVISYDLSYADVLEILRLIDTTPNARKFSLSLGDMQIEVERGGPQSTGQATGGQPAPSPSSPPKPATATETAVEPAPAALASDAGDEIELVRSPIAGIFYRSPSPGEPPFVEVGAAVEEDTVIGIVEVMKVMNNIRAGCRGVVRAVCVDNEALVQFDQALLHIEPAGEAAS